MKFEYEDIVNLPHHVSQNRPRMSVEDRAAQFSAFAALKGYDDAIDEAAKLYDERIEVVGERAEELNNTLTQLLQAVRTHPQVRLTHFCAMGQGSSGVYRTVEGTLAGINTYARTLQLEDGTSVRFEDLLSVEVLGQ